LIGAGRSGDCESVSNDYATMRLLQLASQQQLSLDHDEHVAAAACARRHCSQHAVITEHIYESPDSVRRTTTTGAARPPRPDCSYSSYQQPISDQHTALALTGANNYSL